MITIELTRFAVAILAETGLAMSALSGVLIGLHLAGRKADQRDMAAAGLTSKCGERQPSRWVK